MNLRISKDGLCPDCSIIPKYKKIMTISVSSILRFDLMLLATLPATPPATPLATPPATPYTNPPVCQVDIVERLSTVLLRCQLN